MAKEYKKSKVPSHLVKKSPKRQSHFLNWDNNASQSRHFCRQVQRRTPTDTCHDVIIPWTYTHSILAVYNETTPGSDPRKVGVTCPLVIYDVITPYLVVSWSGMFSQESSSNKDPPVKNMSNMSKMKDMTSLTGQHRWGWAERWSGTKVRWQNETLRRGDPHPCSMSLPLYIISGYCENCHSQTHFLRLISLVSMVKCISKVWKMQPTRIIDVEAYGRLKVNSIKATHQI